MAEVRVRWAIAGVAALALVLPAAPPAAAMPALDPLRGAVLGVRAAALPPLRVAWRMAGPTVTATVTPAPSGVAYTLLVAGATRGRSRCARGGPATITCTRTLGPGFTVLSVQARRGTEVVAESSAVTRRVGRHRVYLTFDDGPAGAGTAAVLDVLRRHRAVGTFFVIGSQVGSHPGLMRRMRADGHAIGDHSWSHPVLSRRGSDEVRRELARTRRAVASVLPGEWLTCYRPPYGATSPRVRRVAAGLGLREHLWSVDPTDWRDPGAATVARRIIAGLRPGSVVLMHDGAGHGRQAAAATEMVLRHLGKRGWTTAILPGC